MGPLALCFVTLVIVWMGGWVHRWRNPTCHGKLPPGSMGLPLLGETIQFFRPQETFDIHPYLKDRMLRYGSYFKTSLLGCKVIVSTDPDFSHLIFQQEEESVEFWYMETFMKLIGNGLSTGAVHKHFRKLVLDYFVPGKQKERFLSEFEVMARRNLAIWSKMETVDMKEATRNMTFGLSTRKIMTHEPSVELEMFKDKFLRLLDGLLSFPLNIPGTSFHKCLKDQKSAITTLMNILNERINSEKKYGDFLDVVIADIKNDESFLTIQSAVYFIYTVLFASFETVSIALTLVIKFISEHPSVLKDLTEEHELILKRKKNKDLALTWDDYKSMTFTSHVIDETLRLGNIAPFVLRRVTKDIQVEGFTIPTGWIIMVTPPTLHLNPDKYEDPLTFNPWRWKGKGPNTASKNFMVFGGGMRLCAGAEFAKMQISIFLHFLVTKYRCTIIKGGEVVRTPRLVFPNGLHVKITEKE